MKKYCYILLLGALISACSDSDTKPLDIDSMVDYIPVRTEINGRWGMMSSEGEMLFENEFENLPTMVINGLFSVEEGEGVSVYRAGDQPKLVPGMEGLRMAGYLNEGLMPIARPNSRISVIKPDGTEAFSLAPIDGHEIVACDDAYSDGRLIVKAENDLYGAVNTSGETVIAPKYSLLTTYSGGFAAAVSDKGKIHILNLNGDIVATAKDGYKLLSQMVKDGEILIGDSDGHVSFMTVDGEISHLPGKVKAVGDYTKEYFAFDNGQNQWGLMSRLPGHEILLRPKFQSLRILPSADKFLVRIDGNYSIINTHGKKVIDFPDAYGDLWYAGYPGIIKYLGADNAGYVAFDARGREIRTPFNIYGIGTLTTLNEEMVQSGFFSEADFVKNIASMVSLNSLHGVQLNAIANAWYPEVMEAPDYSEKREFSPKDQPVKAEGYEMELIGVTDRNISARKYNPKTNAFEPAFVPNNTVGAIELVIKTRSKGIYGKTKDQLSAALQQIGFQLVEEVDDAVTLRSHYANLEISENEDDTSMSVLMYRL